MQQIHNSMPKVTTYTRRQAGNAIRRIQYTGGMGVARVALTFLALGGAFGVIEGATAKTAKAAGALAYTVDPNTANGGVFARSDPHTNDTQRIVGYGVYPNQQVLLLCGVTDGDPVGQYQNRTWHFVTDLSNPGEGNFWLNDHYIQSPNVANQLAPGERMCPNESSDPMQVSAPTPYNPPPSEPWDIPTTSTHWFIDHVVWEKQPQGETLEVFPTRLGRDFARFDLSGSFSEVMQDAHMEYSPTMHDQFVCHAEVVSVYAPHKSSWNLDTWRPDPGTVGTIQARCNPN